MCDTRTEPRLMTPGILAERLGVPLKTVLYILATRPHIRPVARAGILRLYDSRGVEQIGVEIAAMRTRAERRANALPRRQRGGGK